MAELSILTARHQWEHGEISKREFQYREDMWLRDLYDANARDGA